MRDILKIILIAPFLISCARMHDPILHGGGMIKFIPSIYQEELDSVIVQRMTDYYVLDWNKSMFSKSDLNDFHVRWFNKVNDYNIDFIIESEELNTSYGNYDIVWNTNGYYNNIQRDNFVLTENLNDTICKIPDFIYSKRSEIVVSDNIHDYVQGEESIIQIFREELIQRSFMYIVQVTLENNKDRVTNSGTFCISGMAKELDLYSESTLSSTCYVFNTKMHSNVIIGSFISFGLPDCNPYNVRYNYRNGLIEYNNKNSLYIQLIYSQKRQIIEIDVSEQVRLQPTGGLILVNLNIDDYPSPTTEISDPFNVFVDDYESINQYYNTF